MKERLKTAVRRRDLFYVAIAGAGVAVTAAKGTICCATLDVTPMSADATTSDQAPGASG
jgi:hypothetical protein